MMKHTILFLGLCAGFIQTGCTPDVQGVDPEVWSISILPASLRIDPTTNEIINQRFVLSNQSEKTSLLNKNWIYDGERVQLFSARGEYVSFQLVLQNQSENALSNIQVELPRFSNERSTIEIDPELFLEWSVYVQNPSTGYPQVSLGKGWYPDALIPFSSIHLDSSKVNRWTYPLWLPDFNNRIENQKSMIVWVDMYVPFAREEALPGIYRSKISVAIEGQVKQIPVELSIWDFAIPNENKLGASLQQEGFLSRKPEEEALQIYQLLKRNRISVMDPTYKPELISDEEGHISIDWDEMDARLQKYFNGEAFTSRYGYAYGPGYGEPIENYVLPFDVYGKHGSKGWPATGTPDVERNPENVAVYIKCIGEVRSHLQSMLDPEKTDLTVYLNGLDESYFEEAWSRMVFYGDIFQEHYPEAHFRIDGAYSEEAMEYVSGSIDYWGSHTINYNRDKVQEYKQGGIKDWLYGPMLYESKINSWVGSSTFIDLPLVNDRAISWSAWKYGIHSWISWGIGAGWKHAWYDPETWKDAYKSGPGSDEEFAYKKMNGNGMLIYSGGVVPNVKDPCPSIRLKTMRNGIQEYEYMRLLTELSGSREAADRIVNQIINEPFGKAAIGVIDVWEFDAQKWDQSRIQLGEQINELSTKQGLRSPK